MDIKGRASGSDNNQSKQHKADAKPIDMLKNKCQEEVRRYKSGEGYMKAGRYEEALKEFDRVIALNGNHDLALAHHGAAYLGLKQYDEALADFNKALKLREDNIYALVNRGITYRNKGQYDEALADFTKSRTLGYSPPRIENLMRDLERKIKIQRYYDSGEEHLKARRYKKARNDFNRVIALDRKHSAAYAYRGRAYLELNQFKRALADFKRALRLGYSQSSILDQVRQYFEGMCQK